MHLIVLLSVLLLSKIQKPKPQQEVPKVDYSSMNLPPKPEGIEIECFGCSS